MAPRLVRALEDTTQHTKGEEMKKVLAAMAAIALLSLCAASAFAYVETFSTDSANWNYGYGTGFTITSPTTWLPSAGNPDGCISGASNNLYAVWTYDTAIYGDMTGQTLTIDTKVTDDEAGSAQFYVGRGGSYFIDGTWSIGSDKTWTTHTVALDAANFTVWTGVDNNTYTLAEVLQAPDDIGIFFGGSLASGSGNLLVDNYGTVPEPSSILVILTGLGTLIGIRRRI